MQRGSLTTVTRVDPSGLSLSTNPTLPEPLAKSQSRRSAPNSPSFYQEHDIASRMYMDIHAEIQYLPKLDGYRKGVDFGSRRLSAFYGHEA
jgi:hypothetical protein